MVRCSVVVYNIKRLATMICVFFLGSLWKRYKSDEVIRISNLNHEEKNNVNIEKKETLFNLIENPNMLSTPKGKSQKFLKPVKTFQSRTFLSSQRCKVVFPCYKQKLHTIEICGAQSISGLILVKYIKGQMYLGQNKNKFLKNCVGQLSGERRSSQHEEILDPIDRGKRLIFFLYYTVHSLTKDLGSTFDQALGESLIVIDSYDIPQLSFVPENSFAFSAAPFYNDTLTVTVPITKIEYNITSNGDVLGFRDDEYDKLRAFQGKNFSDRIDRMIFSGSMKNTGIGFKYGRTHFEKLAKEDDRFLSFNRPPISYIQQAEYRYVISLSGAGAWTFYRAYTFMLGSVVFCQDSPQKLWYYDFFQPMVHYIPVKEDLSDLKEKLHWARSNVEASAKVALAAKSLATEVFSPQKVMKEYKERIVSHILQREKKIKYTRFRKEGMKCVNKTVTFCKGPKFCEHCVPLKRNNNK